MPVEDLSKVLSAYDMEVLRIRNENYKVKKGVWWIETPEGYKILKKNSIPCDKFDFIIAAIEYLVERGIKMPAILPSKQGEKYVQVDGANYVLNEAIKGNAPSSKKRAGLEMIIKELAKFHAASVGFQAPSGSKPNDLLGTWGHKVSKKMEQLNGFYEEEKAKQEHSAFGLLILTEYPLFRDIVDKALAIHHQSQYNKWSEDMKQAGCLVHQDFIDGNLILDPTGHIYVLDPDSIAFDLPTKDIRKFLNKIMKKREGWDISLTRDILAWYQEENPLEAWQWQVLLPTIMYPHLFVGLMSKYYQQREASWSEDKYVKKLKHVIAIEKSKEPIIEAFNSIIDSLL
ncbi:CotS family spore coat protein [Vallitalea pronyensis]|uniref:CotS family spore coat protein n=1 Tax=Vallitalea pronyensis TaxID=1348613 RepID=A0A8J8SI98_9FIRM|nr:CotS family spore coat protein [Vallitalea pronyensis]QUI24237.1 CotS family spore coat protein [Vallitalea pronyensis]